MQTFIDFCQISEFKGFLDIVIEENDFHSTAQEE